MTAAERIGKQLEEALTKSGRRAREEPRNLTRHRRVTSHCPRLWSCRFGAAWDRGELQL